MRSRKKIKSQQCTTREAPPFPSPGGPFREVCEGSADSSLHYSRISNPVSISLSSRLATSVSTSLCQLLPFLPRSDPFISTFVTAFSVVALFETTLIAVNVKPISTTATRFRIFRGSLCISALSPYKQQRLRRDEKKIDTCF